MKNEIRKRARVTKGMTTILIDDIDDIVSYTNHGDYDSASIAIQTARDTAQRLIDDLTEMDYLLYLHRNK